MIKTYEKEVQCCGGALVFLSEVEEIQDMGKGIFEATHDNGVDMIVTLCPL